jgi:hypothetical protein
MTDEIELANKEIIATLRQHASQLVTYQRGAHSVTVPARVTHSVMKFTDPITGHLRVEWTDRDFIIEAADLVIAATPTRPRRGDVIRESRDGKVYVYEVLAPGNEPEWRWDDAYQQTYRIHCKLVRVE